MYTWLDIQIRVNEIIYKTFITSCVQVHQSCTRPSTPIAIFAVSAFTHFKFQTLVYWQLLKLCRCQGAILAVT